VGWGADFHDAKALLDRRRCDRLTHAVLEHRCPLRFWGESGALLESIADVLGTPVRQYALQQTVTEADWLVGSGLLAPGINGLALRSLSDPGGAYDDPLPPDARRPARDAPFRRDHCRR
jgi:Zn-dependent metalloprotease